MATITNVKFSEKTLIAYYQETKDGIVKGLIIDRSKVEGSENLFETVYGLLEESLKINSK